MRVKSAHSYHLQWLSLQGLSLLRVLCLACTLIGLSLPSASQAHQLSSAHLELTPTSNVDQSLSGSLSIQLSDLQTLLRLDPDNDGKLQWQDVTSQRQRIQTWLAEQFQLRQGANTCKLDWQGKLAPIKKYGATYLQLPVNIQCANFLQTNSGTIQLQYSMLSDQLVDHKLLVTVQHPQQTGQAAIQHIIVDEADITYSIYDANTTVSESSGLSLFLDYIGQGFYHILIGLDHIAFVLCLLLPLGLPASKRFISIKTIVWAVTGFTLAHSITLALSVLGFAPVSAVLIEIAIALSIVFAALNVIFHWVKALAAMTIIFGLIHGYGFAGALKNLGLPPLHHFESFLGFNLGVELGQLLLIAVSIPILLLIRNIPKIATGCVYSCAAIVASIGGYWAIERMFQLLQ